ncbi:MAG: 4Fe-4S cluster-binding domain-containing protein [Planctomycetes bacterium]|nr:4Fe-4S cluster-binding domain-containing protein [Planctomycetota bacterium]
MMRLVQFKPDCFAEVPREISLGLWFACEGKVKCKGCHSPHIHDNVGEEFGLSELQVLLDKYTPFITTVCFLGSEGSPKLARLLKEVKRRTPELKTCLYSGSRWVDKELIQWLDYLKLGEYDKELGGLDSPTTNQRFYNIVKGELTDVTALFR